MIGGTRNRPSTASGAAASTSSRSRPGSLDVVAQHVGQRVRLGHRLDVAEGEAVDVGEVVEHVAELRGQAVDLVGRQRQPGEPGDVDHLGRGDAIGHGGKPTGEGQNPVWQ